MICYVVLICLGLVSVNIPSVMVGFAGGRTLMNYNFSLKWVILEINVEFCLITFLSFVEHRVLFNNLPFFVLPGSYTLLCAAFHSYYLGTF